MINRTSLIMMCFIILHLFPLPSTGQETIDVTPVQLDSQEINFNMNVTTDFQSTNLLEIDVGPGLDHYFDIYIDGGESSFGNNYIYDIKIKYALYDYNTATTQFHETTIESKNLYRFYLRYNYDRSHKIYLSMEILSGQGNQEVSIEFKSNTFIVAWYDEYNGENLITNLMPNQYQYVSSFIWAELPSSFLFLPVSINLLDYEELIVTFEIHVSDFTNGDRIRVQIGDEIDSKIAEEYLSLELRLEPSHAFIINPQVLSSEDIEFRFTTVEVEVSETGRQIHYPENLPGLSIMVSLVLYLIGIGVLKVYEEV